MLRSHGQYAYRHIQLSSAVCNTWRRRPLLRPKRRRQETPSVRCRVDKHRVVELSQAGAQLSKTFRVVLKRLRKKARHIYQRRLGRASQDPGPAPWILKHANKPSLHVSRMREACDISCRKLGLDCEEPLLTPGEVVLRWPKALGRPSLWPSWEGPVACDVYLY